MTLFKALLVTAFIGSSLVFATGCQQKAPAGKPQQSVGDRATESAKIIQESAKRIQDSLKQEKAQKAK
jgi:hypothetical protein